MKRLLYYGFFLGLSLLLHAWLLGFRWPLDQDQEAQAPPRAIVALLPPAAGEPAEPPPPPEPPRDPEEDVVEDLASLFHHPEPEPVEEKPLPDEERPSEETVAAAEPEPADESEEEDEPEAQEEAGPKPKPSPPSIRSKEELRAFWLSQESDPQGVLLPVLDAGLPGRLDQLADLTRSLGMRILAYRRSAEVRDAYATIRLPDLAIEKHVIQEERDRPLASPGFSNVILPISPELLLIEDPDRRRLVEALQVPLDDIVVALQFPSYLARRYGGKVARLSEGVGVDPDQVVVCFGRFRRTPFGSWILAIEELETAAMGTYPVEDPEVVGVFGGGGG